MEIKALISFISGLIAVLLSFLLKYISDWLLSKKRKKTEKTYSERLKQLTSSLTKSAREVDSLLSELKQVARSREETVQKLEKEMEAMEIREKELKEKIETLEKTPIQIVEHFTNFLESGEKRSAIRDYKLFIAGVLVTTLIAIIIQIIAGR